MKGNNELRLNQATMIEAMQLWVNENFTDPPTVASVEMTGATYDKEFVVKVSEKVTGQEKP